MTRFAQGNRRTFKQRETTFSRPMEFRLCQVSGNQISFEISIFDFEFSNTTRNPKFPVFLSCRIESIEFGTRTSDFLVIKNIATADAAMQPLREYPPMKYRRYTFIFQEPSTETLPKCISCATGLISSETLPQRVRFEAL